MRQGQALWTQEARFILNAQDPAVFIILSILIFYYELSAVRSRESSAALFR